MAGGDGDEYGHPHGDAELERGLPNPGGEALLVVGDPVVAASVEVTVVAMNAMPIGSSTTANTQMFAVSETCEPTKAMSSPDPSVAAVMDTRIPSRVIHLPSTNPSAMFRTPPAPR